MKNETIVLLEWQVSKRIENYSLGLFYIYESLVEEGYKVELLISYEQNLGKLAEQIVNLHPAIVAIKYYGEHASQNLKIAKMLKESSPEIQIILGGHTASMFSNLILEQSDAVDVITRNESEKTYLDLCERLFHGATLDGCEGITFREHGIVKKNTDRPLIEDLNMLPVPRYTLFSNNKKAGVFYYAMSTARGCVGNCSFCTVNNMYRGRGRKRWRGLEPINIFENLSSVQAENPDKILMVNFLDSAFEDPYQKTKERMKELCDLLIQKNLKISFSIYSRAESWSLEDQGFIQRLWKAGLNKINLGLDETTNPKSDIRVREHVVLKRNLEAIQLLEMNGIIVTCYVLLFHPFMKLEDLLAYTELLMKANKGEHPDTWTHRLILYPDSKMFHMVVMAGLLQEIDTEHYVCTYAFEDGRVEFISNLMEQAEKLSGYAKLRDIMIETDKILEYGNSYQRCTGLNIEELNRFCEETREYYSQLSEKQGKLFYQMLNDMKEEKNVEPGECLKKWNDIWESYSDILKTSSFQILVKLSKKKIFLF